MNAVVDLFALLQAANENAEAPILSDYDRFLVFFSGGKDSLACVLHLLECGVPPEKIELSHHLVDGREGSTLMDWPVTESYVQAFARHFGLKSYMSWRKGGLEREMLRENQKTAPVAFESEDGTVRELGGDGGSENTRLKFPQTSADLRVRYCSSAVKIDVGARVLVHEPRFQRGKTLVVTGERAEESSSRAMYSVFEPHRCDLRNGKKVQRHIDHWRPVHKWTEAQVWAIIERHRINPHPAYWIGFGRASCRTCVFSSPSGWATVRHYMPKAFIPIANYERRFGYTIHRSKTVDQLADSGTPFECDPRWVAIADSFEYNEPIVVHNWTLPPGAFKESAGPS